MIFIIKKGFRKSESLYNLTLLIVKKDVRMQFKILTPYKYKMATYPWRSKYSSLYWSFFKHYSSNI